MMMKMDSSSAVWALLATAGALSVVEAQMGNCILPTGVDDALAAKINGMLSKQNPWLYLPLAPTVINPIVERLETPIQFRFGKIHGVNNYNVVAMYEPNALDVWGRSINRICSAALAGISQEVRDAHAQIANTFAFAYSTVSLFPDQEATIRQQMTDLCLDYDLLFDMNALPGDPWALARRTVDDMTDFQMSDGWNEDGSLSNSFNRMPYKDFTFKDSMGDLYTPFQLEPNDVPSTAVALEQICMGQRPWFWEPLLESNENGFFTRQEHVTPFIGFTGRLYGITEAEYEAFSTPLPNYDWCKFEPNFVLEQTRVLATSDVEKMEVEFFDSKFTSLLPFQIQFSINNCDSLFEFWHLDMAFVIALYDATMLVWRDKVLFNLVRPTTVVHTIKEDVLVTTYGGPGQGVQTIPGQDWQPYIRTMPHAEYPSASACICTVFEELFQLWTGSDTINIPLEATFPAGSSRQEPGITPAQDLTLTYTMFSQINQACGSSRENGGMHFSQAVPGGNALCSGLAQHIVERANLLEAGNVAGTMADFNDRTINVKSKCYNIYG